MSSGLLIQTAVGRAGDRRLQAGVGIHRAGERQRRLCAVNTDQEALFLVRARQTNRTMIAPTTAMTMLSILTLVTSPL